MNSPPTKTDESVVLRDYNPSRDELFVKNICQDVYGGKDYLPRMIGHFTSSETDFPMVLCRSDDSGQVVAVGNLQIMSPAYSWLQVKSIAASFVLRAFFSALNQVPPQAIRTDPSVRGQGYGTIITRRLTDHARAMGVRASLSSTVGGNAAMHAIFRRLGYALLDTVAVFPSDDRFRSAIADRHGRPFAGGVEFLEALGVAPALRAAAAGAASRFEPCGEPTAAAAVLDGLARQARAGGGVTGLALLSAEYRVYAPFQVAPPCPRRPSRKRQPARAQLRGRMGSITQEGGWRERRGEVRGRRRSRLPSTHPPNHTCDSTWRRAAAFSGGGYVGDGGGAGLDCAR